MSNQYTPLEVQVNLSDQRLIITWADGHRSYYPLYGLRVECPCVECRGGHERMGLPIDPAALLVTPTRRVGVQQLQTIGNYALQIFWDDGHEGGIYTWRMLREACPSQVQEDDPT